MVIVMEINGLTWRDRSFFGHRFGGGWITRNMQGSGKFHSAFDNEDWIEIMPGWHSRMGGGHMADSLYCQMLEVIPGEMPGTENMDIVAAYDISFFSDEENNLMAPGGRINFNNAANFQFHYDDMQADGFNENTIKIKSWNDQTSTWENIDAEVNPAMNTISYSSQSVSNLVILTAEKSVSGIDDRISIIEAFSLKQNYPNPFNPSTSIEFSLESPANVSLTVFNMLGEELTKLVNQNMSAGNYKVNFDARGLSSGIFFYILTVDEKSITRKMNLIK